MNPFRNEHFLPLREWTHDLREIVKLGAAPCTWRAEKHTGGYVHLPAGLLPDGGLVFLPGKAPSDYTFNDTMTDVVLR